MSKVFIDTSAFLALLNKNDKFHLNAKDIRNKLVGEKYLFITTEQIVIEVANSFSKLRFRSAAVKLINLLINSADVEIVWTNEEIFTKAFDLYNKVKDKEWGLTDCISFIVMKNEKIKDAFTTDFHFDQAGFNKLI